MKIRIKGQINDNLFDDFCSLINLHDFGFLGIYNENEIIGDLEKGKYDFNVLKPFLVNFVNRRKLEMIVSDIKN